MKKIALLIAAVLVSAAATAQTGFYGFTVQDATGEEVSLARYRGQVVLVVNTATQCGFTPQYKELEHLYETYRDRGFTILDFPCNQFGGQAPGTMEEIQAFCTRKYDVQFPQFMKVEVNGDGACPLFIWLYGQKGFTGFGKGGMAKMLDKMLKEQDAGYASTPDIKWNFTKFLLDREGRVIARFEPTQAVSEVEEAVKALL